MAAPALNASIPAIATHDHESHILTFNQHPPLNLLTLWPCLSTRSVFENKEKPTEAKGNFHSNDLQTCVVLAFQETVSAGRALYKPGEGNGTGSQISAQD